MPNITTDIRYLEHHTAKHIQHNEPVQDGAATTLRRMREHLAANFLTVLHSQLEAPGRPDHKVSIIALSASYSRWRSEPNKKLGYC